LRTPCVGAQSSQLFDDSSLMHQSLVDRRDALLGLFQQLVDDWSSHAHSPHFNGPCGCLDIQSMAVGGPLLEWSRDTEFPRRNVCRLRKCPWRQCEAEQA
jgi:hypothetical protein